MKRLKLIVFSVCLVSLFIACERDDICPESTPVTPQLIVEFYDFNNPTEEKPVQDLAYFPVGEEDTIFAGSTAQISIPLRTNENNTRVQLIKNSQDPDNFNPDDLRFDYARTSVYINRACGYKVDFFDFESTRITDQAPETNWILNTSVEQSTIENENEAHLYIYH
ncbi:MAG: DUF6452 family protein [Bacteroidota bacterium]